MLTISNVLIHDQRMVKRDLVISEAARARGVTRAWLYKLIKQGRIPGAEFRHGVWWVPADFRIDPVPMGRPRNKRGRKSSKKSS